MLADEVCLDGLSGSRAEIMVGRGSVIESFPPFGYDLGDYDARFDEKLRLLLEPRRGERMHWSGRHRPALEGVEVHPRPVQDPLLVGVAVGGNPPSVVRAASLGLPTALAIIGGQPARCAPLARLFQETAERSGHSGLPMSLNSPRFVGATSQEAADLSFPSTASQMHRIGAERGWPPMRRADFEAQRALHGALVIGSPREVGEKTLWQHEVFGHERFLPQLTVGSLLHREALLAIECDGGEVAPIARAELTS